jgi:P4 family phage/plasmid primase-like protien
MTEAALFLKELFDRAPADTTIVISIAKGNDFVSLPYRRSEIEKALTLIDAEAAAGSDVYVRIPALSERPEPGRRGSEAQTHGSSYLWADIDPYDGMTPLTLEQAYEELKSFKLQPTIVIESGYGLHCYWKLKTYCTDLTALKEMNKWLFEQLRRIGADPKYDLATVLRVPGTVNYKRNGRREVHIREMDLDREYSIEVFGRSAVEELQSVEIIPLPIDDSLLDEIRKKNPRLARRIQTEQGARDEGAPLKLDGSVDRSLNDYFVGATLLAMGYEPGIVLSVLRHDEWFSGHKSRSRGHNGYAEGTILRLVQNRSADPDRFFRGSFHPALLVREIAASLPLLRVGGDLYFYDRGSYRAGGDDEVAARTMELLGDRWKPSYGSEAVAGLKTVRTTPVWDAENDGDPYLLNVRNGMLDLRTGRLSPHDPSYLSIQQVPTVWNPEVDVGEVDKYTREVLPEDAVEAFWEFAGYCLYRGYTYKRFLILWGAADSGKTGLLNLVIRMLGERNTSQEKLSDLCTSGSFHISELFGKLGNIADELSSLLVEDPEVIKQLTGGGRVQADVKHKRPISFVNYAKFIFATNKPPTVRDPDSALYSRFLVIPCTNVFKNTSENSRYVEQVIRRAPTAALRLAVEGFQRLQKKSDFSVGTTMRLARAQMWGEIDSVTSFVEEISTPEPDMVVLFSKVYNEYQLWCSESGRSPLSKPALAKRLRSLPPEFGLAVTYSGARQLAVQGRRFEFSLKTSGSSATISF